MKVQTTLVVLVTLACCAMTGCTEDVKSVEYYAAHPDEALKKLADCRTKDVKAQVSEAACTNPTKGYALFKNAQNKAGTAAAIAEIEKMRKGASQ